MEDLDRRQTEVDSFTREYSAQERTVDETITDVLYFAQDTSFFYLPDRELTEEELLEIIDFNTKRDYALLQRAEEFTEYSQTDNFEQYAKNSRTALKISQEEGTFPAAA